MAGHVDAGRGPKALRQILMKVHGSCNLACDYCYVYEHADQGWRARTSAMSPTVLAQSARRIGEHVTSRDIRRLRVILHGGEPLLAGPQAIDDIARSLRGSVRPTTDLELVVQTNGTLLNEAFLAVFHRHGIRVGVSIDGTGAAHDRHRRFANGRGSHERVARGIALLTRPEHRSLYSGLLCTIDLANDPVETYESLLWSRPPKLDLLLPHGNWLHPPGGLAGGGTPYGDWLIAVFDRWYDAPTRETEIRLFGSILSLLLGGPASSEVIGPDPDDLVVIESDGTIEQHDALKSTVDGGGATGMTVMAQSLDDVLAHEAWSRAPGLGPECRRCPEVAVCGGGLRAHRFDPARGFDRPSVYCADLFALIRHVRSRLTHDIERLRPTMAAERCPST
ncbi:FxsB family cyclophane-forming radical SAM/SPASM peptide maturase [Phytohabitans sp. ZYX-F-186]|uniref:FxsB family cyclophane-forming radical SAM/SPASM peptide maturase n=1 Tax=Phytohabitans maris TaxID=3071409 RepID=A0ABU0ZB98_9ACTN|nr:FxsB family cyclophane-forming radical SAM/SPASM peptide maturase [Phytohabitans sp. ZYX-F-186]MDQ7904334.1 FxsB family cyclophane-forming radical SAM/SPASM peptide maturase [Phytohabitans sp. ZYX-F-186]